MSRGEIHKDGLWIRREETRVGKMEDYAFDTDGYDLWGYDRDGHYSSAHDRAPLQASPFHTQHEPAPNIVIGP